MAGHVFVARGDLTALACDEWLVPTDRQLQLRDPWRARFGGRSTAQITPPPAWTAGELRSFCQPDWPGPRPWLTLIGQQEAPIGWYIDGARAFVRGAAAALRPRPLHGRERHLLALPVLGTRAGGGRQRTGEILYALLQALHEETSAPGAPAFDIALVTHKDAHFAAAQRQRHRLEQSGDHAGAVWDGLDEQLLAPAARLSQAATDGRLALFVGAGVSLGAGLPPWGELLEQLATRAGIVGEELQRLLQLPLLDQAALIEQRVGDTEQLKRLVASAMTSDRVSLMHVLLADLPVREIVTTNYDDLFEQASRDLCQVSCLPHLPRREAPRWILKLHGCVSTPESIVLTREDYLRYEHNRGALAGIVQALLITRRLLFVGFGLRDDNFHRIADEVRRAYPGGHEPFGTNIVIEDQELQRQLWHRDLDWVTVRRPEDDLPAAARRLEILFDRVLAGVDRAPAHLLDATFESILQPGEIRLRDALLGLAELLDDDEVRQDTPGAVREVEALLARLGRR